MKTILMVLALTAPFFTWGAQERTGNDLSYLRSWMLVKNLAPIVLVQDGHRREISALLTDLKNYQEDWNKDIHLNVFKELQIKNVVVNPAGVVVNGSDFLIPLGAEIEFQQKKDSVKMVVEVGEEVKGTIQSHGYLRVNSAGQLVARGERNGIKVKEYRLTHENNKYFEQFARYDGRFVDVILSVVLGKYFQDPAIVEQFRGIVGNAGRGSK